MSAPLLLLVEDTVVRLGHTCLRRLSIQGDTQSRPLARNRQNPVVASIPTSALITPRCLPPYAQFLFRVFALSRFRDRICISDSQSPFRVLVFCPRGISSVSKSLKYVLQFACACNLAHCWPTLARPGQQHREQAVWPACQQLLPPAPPPSTSARQRGHNGQYGKTSSFFTIRKPHFPRTFARDVALEVRVKRPPAGTGKCRSSEI
jgi:hypothetical protein